jgi:hypothetical protein
MIAEGLPAIVLPVSGEHYISAPYFAPQALQAG